MTPERSRTMTAKLEKARQTAQARGHGLEVTIYDCGGYSHSSTSTLQPGDKVEWHRPCTAGHPGHNSVSQEALDAFASTSPTRPANTTEDVARIIAKAADKYRGIDRDYMAFTPQDKVAAEQITAVYYLIPRADFPAVPATAMGSNTITVGNYCFSGTHDKDPARTRRDIASLAAWADYLEQQQTEAAQQAEELRIRRDSVLDDLFPYLHTRPEWDALNPATQTAIARIIELEDALEPRAANGN